MDFIQPGGINFLDHTEVKINKDHIRNGLYGFDLYYYF
jgi:hypothetical protein